MKEIINSKLTYITELIEECEIRLKKYEIEENLQEKFTLYLALSKLIEEIVESAIQINNIYLEEQAVLTMTYQESFEEMLKQIDINPDYLDEIISSARFRNKLVHNYSNLDEGKSILKYKRVIEAYKKYVKSIIDFLEKH